MRTDELDKFTSSREEGEQLPRENGRFQYQRRVMNGSHRGTVLSEQDVITGCLVVELCGSNKWFL